ncbi:POK8 protein, partial [Pelecanoides urinatrix]|nr:POK8 protein [Pelecanoides urinatrix]
CQYDWMPLQKITVQPLSAALTVFTDAGKKSHKAVCTWQKNGAWHHHYIFGAKDDSLQTLELKAVLWALVTWLSQPLNIVSDSLYVVGIVQLIEDAVIR